LQCSFTGVLLRLQFGTTFDGPIEQLLDITGQAPGSEQYVNNSLVASGGVVNILLHYSLWNTRTNKLVNVSVLPTPVGNPISAGTYKICSGTALKYITTSNVSGATYAWTVITVVWHRKYYRCSDYISNNPIDVTYTVVPTDLHQPSALGASFTIVVTVNPTRLSLQRTAHPQSVVDQNTIFCLIAVHAATKINVVNVSYKWRGIVGNSTRLNYFVNGNSLVETLTNTTSSPIM